jgi:hypothetical protein
MSSLDETVARRISKLFRRLSSDFEGEQLATLAALKRLLVSEGLSFSDVAMLIENGDPELAERKYTDGDAQQIFARGVEKGRAENRGVGLSADYFDKDGEPRWAEMVKFCVANPALLSLKPNEQEFVEELQVKLQWRAPSRAMGGFLLSIFWKLGGAFK